nr:MAG: replication initiator protein [Microviridae sp.]
MHEKNSFITLTYNEQNAPANNSLNKREITLFIKKLRKKYGKNIKFFMCGEYGEHLQRPHYHMCLFGHDFADKKLWSVRQKVKLYRSAELEKLWPKGYCTVGDVTFESAAYVARYCLKKYKGEDKEEHYKNKTPEYVNMSRRPGIGKTWWDKYKQDVLSLDKVVIRNNLLVKPPRYYDSKVGVTQLERIKSKRRQKMRLMDQEEFDWERLQVKEIVKQASIKQLKRGYENVNEDFRHQG